MAPYTVLVVSTNRLMQSVLPAMLLRRQSLAHAGSAGSASEALRLTLERAPDVVLSDLPPGGVAEVMTWRAVRQCGPKLVMLTRYVNEGDAMRATLAGASGLILVPDRPIVESVLRAATGELLHSDDLAGRLLAIVSGEAPSLLDHSGRRLLGLVADGCSDDEIAGQLVITPEDVREQIARIAELLN